MKEMIGEKFKTTSIQETMEVARAFAEKLKAGDIVLLSGDLGAGKTVFAKGFALGLGIVDNVISPTFTIMNCYENILNHFDLYRLNSIEELMSIGAEEELYGEKISLVEWPEIVGFEFFPKTAKIVKINKLDEETREILIGLNG